MSNHEEKSDYQQGHDIVAKELCNMIINLACEAHNVLETQPQKAIVLLDAVSDKSAAIRAKLKVHGV